MDKIFVWIKTHLIMALIIIIIIVPVLVYFLSVLPLFPSGDNNDWAGFWGGYIGAIIGGVCTVVGVYWTIQYTQNNYEEDVRNRSLPYIALTTLQCNRTTNLFNLWNDDNGELERKEVQKDIGQYQEYRLDKVFIIIEEGKIKYKKHLSKEEELLIKNGGLAEIQHTNGMTVVDKGVISVPFEFENVGNGAALSFRIGLNREVNENARYIVPSSLKVGEKVYVHIFSQNNIHENINHGKYMLEVYYEDIFRNSYCQQYCFSIDKIKETDRVFSSLDLSGKQMRINN